MAHAPAPLAVPPPPEASRTAVAVRDRMVAPIQRFLQIEAASGVLLLAMAVIALAVANSGLGEAWDHFWHTPVGIKLGDWKAEQSLHFLVNDGLMVIFFFVVGLEIRREMHSGELSDLRRAALPMLAALGGMLPPALIYLALNPRGPQHEGWGVPMATDIAFAVGVMALLGRRVPPALRVLLLALAVIDDIGAIVVIAVFYSSGLNFVGLGIAAAAMGLVLLMQRLAVRPPLAYVVPGLVMWAGMLGAGIHPTIAGVILGLLTPARAWFGEQGFLEAVRQVVEELRTAKPGDDHGVFVSLQRLGMAQREALPPVIRLQHGFHPWVAFVIMPIFALANAGVAVGGVNWQQDGATTVALGVFLGLVVGKPVGIVGMSFLAVKLGLCTLPRGITWGSLWVMGCVAGIGFTMAIFIAQLAFSDPGLLAVGKLAVLAASLASGVFGLVLGRLLLRETPAEGARTEHEAEASTEL